MGNGQTAMDNSCVSTIAGPFFYSFISAEKTFLVVIGCHSLTCVCEEFSGLQDLLCVDPRLIVVHFRSDHVDHSGGSAPNGPGGAIQTIDVFLLQSDDALVDVLQDVVFWGTKQQSYKKFISLFNS